MTTILSLPCVVNVILDTYTCVFFLLMLAYLPWFSGLQVVERRTISDIGIDGEVPISGRE
jgi:hypothetical protein